MRRGQGVAREGYGDSPNGGRSGGRSGGGSSEPAAANVAGLLASLRLSAPHDDEGFGQPTKALARSLLLSPKKVLQMTVQLRGGVEQYLKGCFTNILAEFWAFFSNQSGSFPGWRRKLLQRYRAEMQRDKKGRLSFFEAEQALPGGGSKEVVLEDLGGCLVIHRNKLHIATLCGRPDSQYIVLSDGGDSADLDELGMPDDQDDQDRDVLFSFGSINTFVCELAAVLGFLGCPDSEKPPILRHIADPSSRVVSAYGTKPFATEIPCNAQQANIIRNLKHTVEAIQGPPGTGKSTTIFHILFSRLPEGCTALVTCVQNKAVDSVAEKLGPVVERVPFFVLGQEKNLGASAAAYTLRSQVERNPEVVYLKIRFKLQQDLCTFISDDIERIERQGQSFGISNDIKRIESQGESFGRAHKWTYGSRLREAAKRQAKEISCLSSEKRIQIEEFVDNVEDSLQLQSIYVAQEDANSEALELSRMLAAKKERVRECLIESARAVLSTVDTASQLTTSEELEPVSERVSFVVLDEAGTLPEHKVPLMVQTGPRVVVAVGDQMQLSAFTHCNDQWGWGAGGGSQPLGFFQRLEKALPVGSVPMLEIQYRMHPRTCDFVSATFYNGKLTTGDVTVGLRSSQVSGDAAILHVGYSDYDAESSGTRNKMSKQNEAEAHIVIDILRGLTRDTKSVMVITFYKEQMHLLHSLANDAYIIFNTHDSPLRIVTVDAAQGSEADIVILSCVRSNADQSVGFLSNENRMCVATSRARERLVIVACKQTLSASTNWRRLLGLAKSSTAQDAKVAVVGKRASTPAAPHQPPPVPVHEHAPLKKLTQDDWPSLQGAQSAGRAPKMKPKGARPAMPKRQLEDDWPSLQGTAAPTPCAEAARTHFVGGMREASMLLKEVTQDNIDELADQITCALLDVRSAAELQDVVAIVYERAMTEARACARLSAMIKDLLPTFPDPDAPQGDLMPGPKKELTFKRYLLNRVQNEFEAAADMDRGVKASGTVVFIGELYAQKILNEKIVHLCIKRLLSGESDGSLRVESLCKLLTVCGKLLDHPKAKGFMDYYFDQISRAVEDLHKGNSCKILVRDLIQLL